MKTDSALDYSSPPYNTDVGDTVPRGWSAWFGGPNTAIGPRIAPRIAPVAGEFSDDSDSGLSSDAILEKQLAEEVGSAIQYRTCSWQKTAALLFSEYICLVSLIIVTNSSPSNRHPFYSFRPYLRSYNTSQRVPTASIYISLDHLAFVLTI
jgi:hypothetical protein